MNRYLLLCGLSLLSACATQDNAQTSSAEAKPTQTIKITGTRIKASELPSGPRLTMKRNKDNKNNDFLKGLAMMQSLPQPKEIRDCAGLLSWLVETQMSLRVVDANKVVLKDEHGIYEYTFDDDSCPTETSS